MLKDQEKKEEHTCGVNEEILKVAEQNLAHEKDPGSCEPPSRENIINALEVILKVRIAKVIKYACDQSKYELVLEDGLVIPLGTVDKIVNQRFIKNAIADHKMVMIKTLKAPAWEQYASLLFRLVEVVTPAVEDATEKGSLISTIQEYLEAKGIVKDKDGAFSSGRPFWHKEKAYMFSSDFINWTKFNAEPMTKQSFAMIAASLSIKNEKFHFKVGTEDAPKTTTRAVYEITGYVTGRVSEEPIPALNELPETGAFQ
jgi:hypothetical protein